MEELVVTLGVALPQNAIVLCLVLSGPSNELACENVLQSLV